MSDGHNELYLDLGIFGASAGLFWIWAKPLNIISSVACRAAVQRSIQQPFDKGSTF